MFRTTIAAAALVIAAPVAFAQEAPQTGYAEVNGLSMYYEIHGTGEPLLLLHGAFAPISLWGNTLTTLAQNHQVIAVEFQGHGHTEDIGRPFTYAAFASDVIGVMDHLGIEQADVVGYSMGASVALEIGISYPERVNKLVLASTAFNAEGYRAELLPGVEAMRAEDFDGFMRDAFNAVAPDPNAFPAVVDKIKELEFSFTGWTPEQVAGIAAPTLIVVGDADVVTLDQAVEMFQLLGGDVGGDYVGLTEDQLAVLPGTTHIGVVIDANGWLVETIEAFFAFDPNAPMFPM
ncbi:MAG: alpha/beta fold hydrolase [Bauldia sp.]